MDFLSPWISERMINYTSNEAVFDALKQRNIVVSKISGRNKPVLGLPWCCLVKMVVLSV